MTRAHLGLACLGLAACATPSPQHTLPSAASAAVGVEFRMAQQGFGAQAHFAYCATPTCPKVTPKSLPTHGGTAPSSTTAIPAIDGNRAAATASNPSSVADPHATIPFASNHAALNAEALRRLEALLGALPAAAYLVVTGYTDSTGPQRANDRLAQARARTVAAYVHTHTGWPPDRIEIHARGRCCYLASNRTAEGRTRNRRVEVAVIDAARHSL